MPFQFNNFLFSFLCTISSLSSFLFFLILPQSLKHQTSPTHFNHSFFFSLSLVFSLPLSLAAPSPRPDADLCCYEFFFFFECVQWFDTWFGNGWVEIVMGRFSGGFWCANSMVGGPAYGWVPKDGSTMGGWVGWRWQWVGVWDVVGRWWVVFFVFCFCISVLVVVIRVVVGWFSWVVMGWCWWVAVVVGWFW